LKEYYDIYHLGIKKQFDRIRSFGVGPIASFLFAHFGLDFGITKKLQQTLRQAFELLLGDSEGTEKAQEIEALLLVADRHAFTLDKDMVAENVKNAIGGGSEVGAIETFSEILGKYGESLRNITEEDFLAIARLNPDIYDHLTDPNTSIVIDDVTGEEIISAKDFSAACKDAISNDDKVVVALKHICAAIDGMYNQSSAKAILRNLIFGFKKPEEVKNAVKTTFDIRYRIDDREFLLAEGRPSPLTPKTEIRISPFGSKTTFSFDDFLDYKVCEANQASTQIGSSQNKSLICKLSCTVKIGMGWTVAGSKTDGMTRTSVKVTKAGITFWPAVVSVPSEGQATA
jgi:hypothetical protein